MPQELLWIAAIFVVLIVLGLVRWILSLLFKVWLIEQGAKMLGIARTPKETLFSSNAGVEHDLVSTFMMISWIAVFFALLWAFQII